METAVIQKIESPLSAFDLEDKELFRACQRGEAAAWDALVERYQRLIVTIPRRAGLSEDLVAEVFQEVFLTLFQKLDSIQQPERLRAWLVTTAKFKTWEIFSREKSSRSQATADNWEGELLLGMPDGTLLPDEALLEIEQQHLIRTAIAALDERSRKIITMLYLNEPAASYAEVAAAISVSETSISPLRARALKKLVKLVSPLV